MKIYYQHETITGKNSVRTHFPGEAQDSGWTQSRFYYLETKQTTMTNSLVPFFWVPQGRIEFRHALI